MRALVTYISVLFFLTISIVEAKNDCSPEFELAKPTQINLEADSTSDNEKSVFIYFDQSLSMQGYTMKQPGQENYYKDVIDDLKQIAENVGSKTFYHSFGKRIKPIKQNEIAQVTKPGFYECDEASAACNNQESKIHEPFKAAKDRPNNTYIIVTDLFLSNTQLESTARAQLVKPLKSILKKGKSIGIIGVMSSFNGTIYDIPAREDGTISYTEAKKRPFYIIVIGDQKEINQVKKNLEEQHFMDAGDQYKYSLITSTPILQNLNENKLITENDIASKITKAENFKFEYVNETLPVYKFDIKKNYKKKIKIKFKGSDIIVPGSSGVSSFKINNTLWSSKETKCKKIDEEDWRKDKRVDISKISPKLSDQNEELIIELFAKKVKLGELFWGRRYYYLMEIYAETPGSASEETFKEWSVSDADAQDFTERNPTEFKTLNLTKIIKILNSVANDEFNPTLIASLGLNFNLLK